MSEFREQFLPPEEKDFTTLEYYQILNRESSLTPNKWYISPNKQHPFKIYSDFDALGGHAGESKISVPPSSAEEDIINLFSDKLGQKIENTKIVTNLNGTERIELELEDRIVTIITDQSGSMTWNDNNNFRHDIASDLINKISINYPGTVFYNLIEYGADIVNVLFFGVIESDDFDPNDIDSLSKMIKADDKANYDGIRIIRNEDHYPNSVVDGDLVDDGFISRVKDGNLTEGQTYYYTVYTYDKNLKFSEGVNIKVTPRERVVPRATSSFRSFIDSDDLSKGIPFVGYGVNRDEGTIGIWHMDEGEGASLYDFSDTNAVLSLSSSSPSWDDDRFVPCGISGVFFDGETDRADIEGETSLFLDVGNTSQELTVMAWVFPYKDSGNQMIAFSMKDGQIGYELFIADKKVSFGGVNFAGAFDVYTTDDDVINLNQWNHIAAVYSNGTISIYINGSLRSNSGTAVLAILAGITGYEFNLGAERTSSGLDNYFYGKMTEVSIHNIARSSDYINAQLVSSPILNEDGEEVDREFIGLKEENGDRFVVLKYDIPRDFNFTNGEILVLRNEEKIPSWEEDGDVIYALSNPSFGQFFISNPDDFVLGEKYYYRLFTKNDRGNVSFLSDSPYLEVTIPEASTDDYFLSFYKIDTPLEPDVGQLITAGNEKTYIRWKQKNPIDSDIARTKIYYSSLNYPVVNSNGGSSGKLVFTGLVTDDKFVHRDIPNDTNAFYTIVNVDKYGRPSNYDENGIQIEEFLHASAMPSSSADEGTFPLIEVENVNYELFDEDTVTIGWDQPKKSLENIEAYFDQTVYIYGAITDEFGSPVPEDTPINMKITSSIQKEIQADDVFSNQPTTSFEDKDAYDFFVTRTADGVFKAILRMTSNVAIISQIKEASFDIKMQVLIPKEGGYTPPNDDTPSSNSLIEYASVIEDILDAGHETTTTTSNNFYEYRTKTVTVHYTNPWEIELVNRDNKKVPQKCYCIEEDDDGISLSQRSVFYNGIYMKASSPFVARAKVKYKGQTIESGNIQVSVWDIVADADHCSNACGEEPGPNEGSGSDKVSQTVLPPAGILSVVQGTEETFDGSGEYVNISYVDIPLYAPDLPQAVRLYVKGEQAGYSSIKDMYILFQSILQVELEAETPAIDGKDIGEQKANVFIVNPDYPNYQTNEYDKSLVTYPDDFTIAQWDIAFIWAADDADGSQARAIYSSDSVPLTNGTYSYIRNGVARNVFIGPIPKGDKKIEETHEIKVSIVYEGLTSFAKQFINFNYNPVKFDKTSARFLMEIDGGWGGKLPNQTYGGSGWLNSDKSGNILWADGIHYKKLKISRDPRTASDNDFESANCFRACAISDDNELLELSSGQVVEILAGGDSVEILHGEVFELENPYTGVHYLTVGENGFIDKGSAFVELNDEEDSDITYFYIRVNAFVPNAKRSYNDLCKNEVINDCICLKSGDGIKDCDFPEWTEVIYVSGKTTIFVNNQPLILNGGGNMSNGIPPCPICLNEPLIASVEWRRVTDYVINKSLGDPSNDFIFPVVINAEDNDFLDANGETLIKHNSEVDIRIRFAWRGDPLPDGSPVFISIGDNTGNSIFVADRSIYYTRTDEVEGYSYVDVKIESRATVEATFTENIEIYATYDESKETDRRVGKTFNLTLDKKDDITEPIEVVEDDPSVTTVIEPPDISPYSKTMYQYNIVEDKWNLVASMSEARGNGIAASVNNIIYYMGGLKNNSLDISKRNEKYHVSDDYWEEGESMPEGRFSSMSVVIGNDVYVIGGIISDSNLGGELTVSTLVEVYHTVTDTWENLPSMPIINEGTAFEEQLGIAFGRAQHAVIEGNNYIYIVGGIKDVIANSSQFEIREYNQRILRYCVEDNQWEYSSILRSNELNTYERVSPLSIVFDDKIIVFNGAIESGDDFIYPIEDFYIDIKKEFSTPSSGFWINFSSGFLRDFPIPKFQSAFVENDENPSTDAADYYLIGGSNDNSPSLDLVERISVTSGTFSYASSYDEEVSASIPLTALPVSKHGLDGAIGVINDVRYIYVMGGYTLNRDESFVDIEFDI